MGKAPTSLPFGDGHAAEAWVSIEQVAAYVGVRKDSVYRWIENRGLPAQKIGKLWKLKLSEVDAWMRSGGRKRARHEPLSPVLTAQPGPTILVVDDDEVLRETIGDYLSDQGYSVVHAADGAEALAMLRGASGARPSLIVLDLVMPVMDGWQFRDELGRDPVLSAIPVLLITAERRIQLTGPDVLWKPLDLGLLRDAVRRHLRDAP